MDYHEIAVAALSVLAVTYGWFLRSLWTAVTTMQKDVRALEVALPTSYVSKSDDERRWSNLMDTLQRIEAKLDGKQDK
jgi:RNAse (barnase) inhibitor barstar